MGKREKKVRKHKGLGWKIFLALVVICAIFAVIKFVPFGLHDLSPAPDVALTADGGFDYGIPLDSMSPWAKFRANALNNGRSAVAPLYIKDSVPWSYRTGKGIFSSPVVDVDGNCYIGSADTVFYCFAPDGSVKWRFQTGEIIDSSALLDDQGRVYFGSGDANVYCLDRETGTLIWKSPAQTTEQVEAQYGIKTYNVNWFEGNIGMLPDGTLLAPNDNYLVYALNREDGVRKTAYPANEMVWSLPSVNLETGKLFFASCYQILQNVFAYDVAGNKLWETGSFGTVAATTMLTSSNENGAVIVGGFDGFVRAFAQDSGKLLWKFGTKDHIYASPAQLRDGTIIQGSTDGTLYAINPHTGKSVWQFDTLEPIRSSPAVDGNGNIYFGNGEGKLYCVNPDGTLRWSYQCITDVRNDLNGSPALGYNGVFIAGESGEVFFVPYDYPLTEAGKADPRCYSEGELMPSDGPHLLFTTAFGSMLLTPPESIDANEPITLSLLVRENGDTVLSALDRNSVRVTIEGNEGYRVEVGATNRFVNIVPPLGGWKADASGKITVRVDATYVTGLSRFGLKFFGGKNPVDYALIQDFSITQGANTEKTFQTAMQDKTQSVLELSRLSVPTPSILPSYNQIGFDSLHYIAGAVDKTDSGDLLMWVVEGRLTEDGTSAIDPSAITRYPLLLHQEDGLVTLYNDDGFKIKFIGSWDMPFASYRVSAPLASEGTFARDADVVAVTNCDEIEFYGIGLKLMGMSEFKTGQMFVRGGVRLTQRADAAAPLQLSDGNIDISHDAGGVLVGLNIASLRADEHVYSLLLTDASGHPLPLYYTKNTIVTANDDGTVGSILLKLDKGETIPADARLYLMVDTYPVFTTTLAD
ncbi:MAG TPA: PQQ-binding-like beta-propeller repeat protein [Clostridia bacterium]|nr:PQQ-binding-like beta-propeller repeat protein [Clostridia bacterium]